MNCPECGHAADTHTHWGECLEKGCHCFQTRVQIECDAWEAEALAARKFIHFLERQFSWNDDTVEQYDIYYATRTNK